LAVTLHSVLCETQLLLLGVGIHHWSGKHLCSGKDKVKLKSEVLIVSVLRIALLLLH